MDMIYKELQDICEYSDYRIFCHFTDNSYESIFEDGLYLEQDKWYTTMLELQYDERANIKKFIYDQIYPNSVIKWKKYLIVVAVPNEDEVFISRSNFNKYDYNYVIDKKYILCAVDFEEKEIEYNEDSILYENNLYTR